MKIEKVDVSERVEAGKEVKYEHTSLRLFQEEASDKSPSR